MRKRTGALGPLGRKGAVGLILLFLLILAAAQQPPPWQSLASWVGIAALAAGALWIGRRWPGVARIVLIGLAFTELWLGARALPFSQATAPMALSLRNAPATVLSATASRPPAARDRFLSMSDIRYDPGDLAELRGLHADRLPSDAVERLVRAEKQVEVLAPNLSLLFELPAVDGYDGGMLPIRHYVEFQSLFLPSEQLLTDGRLREQLHQIPDGRLLDLAGIRYVITDKQNDLWADDVYYDLEQAVEVGPGETVRVDLSGYPSFSATALGLVSHLAKDAGVGRSIARITLSDDQGRQIILDLNAPTDTTWSQDVAGESHTRVARRWPDWMGAGHDFLAIKEFRTARGCQEATCAMAPTSISVQVLPATSAVLVLRGMSLIDERTSAHQSITLSPHGDFRRIHSGDVKVYERIGTPGRVWLVHGIVPAADAGLAQARLADSHFNPRASVVIQGDLPARPPAEAVPGEDVTILAYAAERIDLRVTARSPAFLVLADTFYPGWEAALDGQPVSILRANLLFRAIEIPAGTHQVTFAYRPVSWRCGVGISAGALVAFVLAATRARVRRSRPDDV